MKPAPPAVAEHREGSQAIQTFAVTYLISHTVERDNFTAQVHHVLYRDVFGLCRSAGSAPRISRIFSAAISV
ncbi:MAG: hypothetical protein GPOALKHO_001907 [Sodalis sp.]|nr:MAG: hypothetical protein GPOALKHO_001907 [Sodalis sp.]